MSHTIQVGVHRVNVVCGWRRWSEAALDTRYVHLTVSTVPLSQQGHRTSSPQPAAVKVIRMSVIQDLICVYLPVSHSSLPCVVCDGNGDAKMPWPKEVHAICRQCHVRKALSSRLKDVLESRLHMR